MRKCFKHVSIYTLLFFLSSISTAAAADKAEDKPAKPEKEQNFTLEEVVVTAPKTKEPLKVETDPKHPRQPVPAADGAGYLKNIPGFSMVRKGGTGGDPIFRGLGGSRLNIVMNGGYILGGCPNRMDPTTAYIFPETFSKITVLKGPESVEYGSSVAGSILFERDTAPFAEAGTRLNTSLLFGSDNRRDQLFDITQGDKKGYVRVIRTKNKAGDYRDGNGNYVHSAYLRNSTTGIIGFTPDENTLLEFSFDTSSGKADYADRTVDGTQFDRDSYNVRFEKRNISNVLKNIKINFSHNKIDHIMDNYTLRPLKPGTMPASMEVKRTTTSGRMAFEFNMSPKSSAVFGLDYQKNKHSGNMIMGVKDYSAQPLTPDMTFTNYGVFADFKTYVDANSRLLSGVRFDDLTVKYAKYPGKDDHDKTYAAFLRYEHDSKHIPVTSYVGIGHAERPADWWERKKTGGMSASPEKNTQLDVGWLYHKNKTHADVSLFYSNIDDFILVTDAGNAVKNIDAALYGGEANYTYKFSDKWSAGTSLAYTYGRNKTNGRPLPQIAPFEATFSLNSKFTDKWEAGLLWRLVASQTRYSVGEGNEIGTDIGPSGGFGILSLNTSYRPNKDWTIAAGVDNILNKNYAEFVSRGGVDIATVDQPATVRVNEPGRTFWLKANYNF